jgi:hypothetical protein
VSVVRLLDVDLARLRSGSLGNEDAQDSVLQAGLDSILVDACRECKAAMELSDRAFRDPVLGLGGLVLLGNLLLVRLLGDLGVSLREVFLDGGLVTKLLLLRSFAALNEALWALALLADILVTTGDGESVVIGPLDVDVLLLNTGKLSMEFIALLSLLNVELGCEGPDVVELAVDVAEGLAIILIEEPEDGSELLSETREERHCCWCVVEVPNSCGLRDAIEL